ncbi:MAG: hypothetical protein JNJ44_09265 [Zoogloeaceae bacterium]|nr:hypothetical protein [Zoogloeaceae bacterium]
MVRAHAQPIYGDLQAPLAGRVYGLAIHTADAEELRYVVLRHLTDRYAAEQRIDVTAAEQQAYVRRVREGLLDERRQQQARRDALTRQLVDVGLSRQQRERLAAELDGVNQALDALGPGTDAADDRQIREQIAAAFIRQWKINQALHRQYGGRIVYQQGGPEPLDAYREFLQQAQARGDFAIYDATLEAPFWRYYRTDSLHSFYPRGSREESQAFDAPFWQSEQKLR